MPRLPIYMDHHATTPVEPRVLAAMLPYFTERFGNAASKDHPFGYQASQAVEPARVQVAALINARPDEIIFTSGATESDNLALFGVAERYADQGDHFITVLPNTRRSSTPRSTWRRKASASRTCALMRMVGSIWRHCGQPSLRRQC